ncbi:DRTGG domain-containing protein [Oscillospiraceae bacterium 21-37]|nr:hypothetical protein [Acutalibacter sp.]
MMIKEMAEACGWKLLAGEEGTDAQVDGCYIGDLLSWVMARALSGNVWLTVMGNVNAIAVAALTDVAGIVLAEDAALDEAAKNRAELQGIPVYTCPENLYETALKVAGQLGQGNG